LPDDGITAQFVIDWIINTVVQNVKRSVGRAGAARPDHAIPVADGTLLGLLTGSLRRLVTAKRNVEL
jgi:hypothetical protein